MENSSFKACLFFSFLILLVVPQAFADNHIISIEVSDSDGPITPGSVIDWDKEITFSCREISNEIYQIHFAVGNENKFDLQIRNADRTTFNSVEWEDDSQHSAKSSITVLCNAFSQTGVILDAQSIEFSLPDMDGDGLHDLQDPCPTTVECLCSTTNSCPDITVLNDGVVTRGSSIQFPIDVPDLYNSILILPVYFTENSNRNLYVESIKYDTLEDCSSVNSQSPIKLGESGELSLGDTSFNNHMYYVLNPNPGVHYVCITLEDDDPAQDFIEELLASWQFYDSVNQITPFSSIIGTEQTSFTINNIGVRDIIISSTIIWRDDNVSNLDDKFVYTSNFNTFSFSELTNPTIPSQDINWNLSGLSELTTIAAKLNKTPTLFSIDLTETISISHSIAVKPSTIYLTDSIGISDSVKQVLTSITNPITNTIITPTPAPQPTPTVQSSVKSGGSSGGGGGSSSSGGGGGSSSASVSQMEKIAQWLSTPEHFKIGVRTLIALNYVDLEMSQIREPPAWFYQVPQYWENKEISDQEMFNALNYILK